MLPTNPITIHLCMQSDDAAPAPGTFLRWDEAPMVNGVIHLRDMVHKTTIFQAKILFSEALPDPEVPLRCRERKDDLKHFTLETVRSLPGGSGHWLCILPCKERFADMMLILGVWLFQLCLVLRYGA